VKGISDEKKCRERVRTIIIIIIRKDIVVIIIARGQQKKAMSNYGTENAVADAYDEDQAQW